MTTIPNAALTVSVQDRTARITLTRPEVRNAFNDEVIQQLKAAFESVGARDDVRAVVRRPELDAPHGRLHAR